MAPTAPTNLRTQGVGHTWVSLAWDPSTDNSGTVFYDATLRTSDGPLQAGVAGRASRRTRGQEDPKDPIKPDYAGPIGGWELGQAVAGLYRVFARYPLREDVSYCDHCVGPQQVRALHRSALNEVTADALRPLLMNYSTWGDRSYHLHFLPRLLELTASGAMNTASYPTFLPGILVPGRDGSVEERDALDRFIAAWWHTTLTTWPTPCEPLDILELLDACGRRVAAFLAAWPTDGGEPPTRHLIALVMDLTVSSHGDGQFWTDVDHWLCGPVPEAFLTSATRAGPIIAPARDALECLYLHRQWRCGEGEAGRDLQKPQSF